MTMIMTKRGILCSLLAPLLLSVSCAPKTSGLRDNAGLESIYKAEVRFEQSVHTISFRDGGISPEEETALSTFISAKGLSYSDRLTLRMSEPNRAEVYRKVVNATLGHFGLSLNNVEVSAGITPEQAVLVVSRAAVTLPTCGLQSGPHIYNFHNTNLNNYGCATRSNLAAMVANPADLVSGSELGLQPAATTAKPLSSWDAHTLTGLAGGAQGWTAQGPGPRPGAATTIIESATSPQ